MKNNKIVIIGSGNVAAHLAFVFKKAGLNVLQIQSRNYFNAEALAKIVDADAVSDLSKIDTTADYYFIAVSDKAICQVVSEMPLVSGIVVHTAGCVPISVLDKFSFYGSFYPLQTFTKGMEVDFEKIWLFIEGNNEKTTENLLDIASKISKHVEKICTEKRALLHLAATISCNFVNHLYAISQNILEEAGLSFDFIKPLIEETAQKACKITPYIAQTGPARRNDQEIMQCHRNKLVDNEQISDIYRKISDSISDVYRT